MEEITIERIVAAVQRSTHMPRRQMRRHFPELMAAKREQIHEDNRRAVVERKNEILEGRK